MRRRDALRALALIPPGASALAGCGPLRPFGVPDTAGSWERREGLATPRDDFALAAVQKRLYAVGGLSGERGRALDSVEVLDLESHAWSRGARLPLATSSARAVTLGDRILLAGGAVGDEETSQVWTHQPESGAGVGRWESAPPLRTPRFGHGMASTGGLAYVAGGLRRGEPLASAEVFDAARGVWLDAAPLPLPRFNLALVAARGRLYAIGGSGPDRKLASDVFVYDLSRDRWEVGPPLPVPLSNFGAAATGDRIHALLHRLHFVLDTGRNVWARAAPMPTSRHGHGVAWRGGALYALGGCSEDPQRDLSSLEVFRPLVG